MSVAYYLFPASMVAEDTAFADRLRAIGVPLPGSPAAGRFPTPAELRSVLPALGGGVAVQPDPAHQELVLWVEDETRGLLIQVLVQGYSGQEDDDKPREVYFPRAQPEAVVELARLLCGCCGPLLLTNDLGECALVTQPSDDPGWEGLS